jgi:dipeptidyl aminopeptidase/acylaminoacyl peptidase
MKTASRLRLLAAVLLCCAPDQAVFGQATQPVAMSPAAMAVKDLIRRADFSDVKISPDGRYFSALLPNDDKPYENLLAVFDTQTHKPISVITSGRTLMFYEYFWASNDRIVTTIGSRQNGLDSPARTGEILAFDANGAQPLDLFGIRARDKAVRSQSWNEMAFPVTTDPAIDRNILVSVKSFSKDRAGVYTEARLLNIDDATEIHLTQSPGRNAEFFADHNGKARFAMTYDDDYRNALWVYIKQRAVTPNQASSSVFATKFSSTLAAVGTMGNWHLINNPATSGMIVTPIGFSRDNKGLYERIERGKGPQSIAFYDFATRSQRLIYRGKFANPGDVLPTADGKDYYAVITQDGQKSLFYIDPDSMEAKLNQSVSVNFPGQLAYFSSFARDGKHAIVTVVSDRNPGDYYLFDLDTHKLTLLTHARPWIDPKQMSPMQPITLNARDGLPLHGFITLPTSGSKPYPLIVLPHGGPVDASDTWDYNEETQLFASRGYAVLQVNYRGSGGGGAWFQGLGYKQWGLSMQDDLTDATKWAVAQGYADPGRMCIYGASYGGYAALEGVVREPDLYKCAIGYDGTYDLRVQLDDSDTQRTDAGEFYLHSALGDDRDDLLRRSPLAGVAAIKANILLLHGGEDVRTPYKNFQEFTHALRHEDKTYETLVERHEGHGFYLPEHRQEAYEKMLEFLDQNIGPSHAAANSNATAKASP